jgi:hypothetical protein
MPGDKKQGMGSSRHDMAQGTQSIWRPARYTKRTLSTYCWGASKGLTPGGFPARCANRQRSVDLRREAMTGTERSGRPCQGEGQAAQPAEPIQTRAKTPKGHAGARCGGAQSGPIRSIGPIACFGKLRTEVTETKTTPGTVRIRRGEKRQGAVLYRIGCRAKWSRRHMASTGKQTQGARQAMHWGERGLRMAVFTNNLQSTLRGG